MPDRIKFSPENVLRTEVTHEVLQVKVPSQSQEGVVYYVSISASCQCKSYLYRGKCAHVGKVLNDLLLREDGVFEVPTKENVK